MTIDSMPQNPNPHEATSSVVNVMLATVPSMGRFQRIRSCRLLRTRAAPFFLTCPCVVVCLVRRARDSTAVFSS